MKTFIPTAILVLYAFFATKGYMMYIEEKCHYKPVIDASELIHYPLKKLSEIEI